MLQTKQWLMGARLLCDEIGSEDGIDPRLPPRTLGLKTEKQSHKGRQLCKAVKRTLSLVLGGEFSDPRLQSLLVVDVTSSKAGESLYVSLGHLDGESAAHEEQIMEKLYAIQGSLRAAIARSVKRKRVPVLRFQWEQTKQEESSHAHS